MSTEIKETAPAVHLVPVVQEHTVEKFLHGDDAKLIKDLGQFNDKCFIALLNARTLSP